MSYTEEKRYKGLTTNEIFDIIKDLASDDAVIQADVYIDPPSGNIETLFPCQLSAPAELILHVKNFSDDIDEEMQEYYVPDEYETPGPSVTSRLVRKRGRLVSVDTSPDCKPKKTRKKWVNRDLPQNLHKWTQLLPRSVLTLSEASDPVDFFKLFFSHEVIMHIVRNSITYAVQKGNPGLTLCDNDIYCFIGILILSGYSPLPQRHMYWEDNEDTQNVLVAKSMRRNRFEEILRYFHVADNENLTRDDKMAKVRPLFDLLNEKFLQYAVIEKDVNIDEAVVPYYGRHNCNHPMEESHPMKNLFNGKPVRFGYKTWVAALRSGYCLYADPYEGQYETRTVIGRDIVKKLMSKIQNVYKQTSFSVYCDDFFTELPLVREMKGQNIFVTGTIRRKFIKECRLRYKTCTKQERGYHNSKCDVNNGICAVVWNDNSVVSIISSEYGVQPQRFAKRHSTTHKQIINIPQPNVLYQYNRFKDGVSQLDANIETYRIAIRGEKWYIPLVFWLIDVAVNNATLLARSYSNEINTLEFQRSIAKSLLKTHGKNTQRVPFFYISTASNTSTTASTRRNRST